MEEISSSTPTRSAFNPADDVAKTGTGPWNGEVLSPFLQQALIYGLARVENAPYHFKGCRDPTRSRAKLGSPVHQSFAARDERIVLVVFQRTTPVAPKPKQLAVLQNDLTRSIGRVAIPTRITFQWKRGCAARFARPAVPRRAVFPEFLPPLALPGNRRSSCDTAAPGDGRSRYCSGPNS